MPDKPSEEPLPATDAPVRRAPKRKARHPFAIPRVPFRRLVHEIMEERKSDLRIQDTALEALQESVETLLVERFGKCSKLMELCNLETVREEHWRFVHEQDSGAITLLG